MRYTRLILLLALFNGGALWAAPSPGEVVTRFYTWYVSVHDGRHANELSPRQDCFDPELYQQLIQAYQHQPEDGAFLDVDPFVATQWDFKHFTVQAPHAAKSGPAETIVPVTCYGTRNTISHVDVHVRQLHGRWAITNLSYERAHPDLMTTLRSINRQPLKHKS